MLCATRLPLAAWFCLASLAAPQDAPEAEIIARAHTLEEITVDLRDGGELTAERGVLFAPIVRANPESATIEVEFHRFRSAPEHAERPPIFFLNGGPGFPGLSGPLKRSGFYEDNLKRLVDVADVVVVGQRGIGTSKPNTVCKAPPRETLAAKVTDEESGAAIAEACRACKERWESEGLDLSGLSVIEAAADVIEIADVFGYETITLVGGSFGSHWGMAILRFHEDRVARALLNGLEGPDHTYDMPSFVLNALKRIAESAEAAPELADHIPEGGLIRAFEAVIARVTEEPVTAMGGRAEVLFDARRVRDMALGYTRRASSRQGARSWPADIITLAGGDFKVAAESVVRRNFLPSFPTASFFMLDCGSGISAARHAKLLADPAAAIVGPLGSFYDAACPTWEADLGEDFRADFETDVPTVLVHGTWDTSTPFENALELAPCFKRSKLVVVEGGSHGAMGEALRASDAFRDAVTEFLATGTMEDVPTLVELPQLDWVVPGDERRR